VCVCVCVRGVGLVCIYWDWIQLSSLLKNKEWQLYFFMNLSFGGVILPPTCFMQDVTNIYIIINVFLVKNYYKYVCKLFSYELK